MSVEHSSISVVEEDRVFNISTLKLCESTNYKMGKSSGINVVVFV